MRLLLFDINMEVRIEVIHDPDAYPIQIFNGFDQLTVHPRFMQEGMIELYNILF